MTTEFDAVKWLREFADEVDCGFDDKNTLRDCAAQLESAKEQAAAAQAENLRIADCAAKLIKSYASQWRKDFETTGHAKTGFIAGNVRTSELGELISLALAQPPSRAALDAYVAEKVKRLEDRMRQWAMENLQSGSPRRESFYAVLENEVGK